MLVVRHCTLNYIQSQYNFNLMMEGAGMKKKADAKFSQKKDGGNRGKAVSNDIIDNRIRDLKCMVYDLSAVISDSQNKISRCTKEMNSLLSRKG